MSDESLWRRRTDDWHREIERELTLLRKKQEKIDRLLSGDPVEHEDGIETRLHLMERIVNKLEVTIGNHEKGLWKDLVDLRADITNLRFDLKDIKEDKSIVIQNRGLTLTYRASIIAAWLGFAGFALTNLDKATQSFQLIFRIFKHESPAQELDRLEAEIADLKKKRGPDVKKRLRELRAAAQQMEGNANTWK